MSGGNLNKWARAGVLERTKAEISNDDLENILKIAIPDPSKKQSDWLELSMTQFIDEFSDCLAMIAKKNLQVEQKPFQAGIERSFPNE